MPNSMSALQFLLVDSGGDCCCYLLLVTWGNTKSTPSLPDLDRTVRLDLEFDNKARSLKLSLESFDVKVIDILCKLLVISSVQLSSLCFFNN